MSSDPVRQTNKVGYDGTGLVTVVAMQLTELSLSVSSVLVQADPDNTGTVWVGFEMGQSVQLAPGDVWMTEIDNPSKVYVRGSDALQRYNWQAVGGS